MQKLKPLDFILDDGSTPSDGSAPIRAYAQPRAIPMGVDVEIPFRTKRANKDPKDATGGTYLFAVRAPDGTLLLQRGVPVEDIDPLGLASRVIINRGDTAAGGAASSDLPGTFSMIWIEPVTGYEWRGVEQSAWIPSPTDANSDDPVTPPEDAVLLVGLPSPLPTYKARMAWDGSAPVWQQFDSDQAVFDGSVGVLPVEWADFDGRPFVISIATRCAEVAGVTLGEITDTGCNVYVTTMMACTVDVSVEEVIS